MNRIACCAAALLTVAFLGGCEDKSAERKISGLPANAKLVHKAAKREAEPAPERPEKKDWKKSARKAAKKDKEPAPAAEAPRTLGAAPPFGPGSSSGGSGRGVRRT